MNVFLIIIEPYASMSNQDVNELERFVESLNGICLTKTVFAVKTDYELAEEVFELLKIYVGNARSVIVVKTASHFFARAPEKVWDWLNDHL